MARVKYYDHQSGQWKYADTALGIKGDPGKTPEKGVDYFTEEDKQEMIGRLIDEGVLTYNEQELTEEQKAQARENIGIDQISFDKLTEDLDADGFRITNLPLPQSGSEPATKEFVENFTIEGSTYVATDDGEGNVTIRPYLADEDELVFKSHIQNQNNPHNVTAAQVGARPNNWMPTAEEVKARPDTWIPTAAEVGAATPQDVNTAKTTAISEAKTYTNEQVKKAAPRNLLDNSDFRNPVNQRGFVSGSEVTGYWFDRWRKTNANGITVSYDSDGITITTTANTGIKQSVPTKGILSVGDTVTFAICEKNGTITTLTHTFRGTDGYAATKNTGNGTNIMIQEWLGSATASIDCNIMPQSTTAELKWAALYPGEFTLNTLPEYQPKGYGAELAECKRYYQKIAKVGIFGLVGTYVYGFSFEVEFRKIPTVNITYLLDLPEWTERNVTSVTADTKGVRYIYSDDCKSVAHRVDGYASADL